jgi:hypothetical protein
LAKVKNVFFFFVTTKHIMRTLIQSTWSATVSFFLLESWIKRFLTPSILQ